MSWGEWCSYSIYKKLWSLVGGRPWTYIYRDLWHKYEFLPQTQWFFMGVLVLYASEHWIEMSWIKACLIFWLVYSLGYINGHFFWGRKYIPDQKGDE